MDQIQPGSHTIPSGSRLKGGLFASSNSFLCPPLKIITNMTPIFSSLV